jgi:hypothetical protein
MAGPLGGGDGGPGAPTINVKNIDDDPLGDGAGDLGAPTINAKNVDSNPPKRRYQRLGSTHHQHKKHQQWAPWEAMPEIQEHPLSTQETSTVGPLGGDARDLGAPTINT